MLLQRREHLARTVAEREAHHRLEEGDADLNALLDLEVVVEERFPAVYEAVAWSVWVLAGRVLRSPARPGSARLQPVQRNNCGAQLTAISGARNSHPLAA